MGFSPVTSITLAPVNILHIIYATMTVFGCLLIFGKHQYKALGLLLIAHFIQEIFNIFEELNITRGYLLVTPAIQLALGPLYYLFAKNLIYGNLDVKKHLIHLLPAVVALAFTVWWPMVLKVAFAVLLIYFYLTFRLLRHYHRVLAEVTADDDNHALHWLIRTFAIVGVVEFVDFIRLNIQLQLGFDLYTNWYFVSELFSLTVTTYLVLKAIRQPLLFAGFYEFEPILGTNIKVKDTTADDDAEQARIIFSDINEHLQQSLGYRQEKYSLRQLAGEMGLSEQMTSWSINQGGKLSFSDYINAMRIDEVKLALLEDSGDKNILEIAFNAGFSSKSTFNAVFKRHLGITPSQYLKNHQSTSLK